MFAGYILIICCQVFTRHNSFDNHNDYLALNFLFFFVVHSSPLGQPSLSEEGPFVFSQAILCSSSFDKRAITFYKSPRSSHLLLQRLWQFIDFSNFPRLWSFHISAIWSPLFSMDLHAQSVHLFIFHDGKSLLIFQGKWSSINTWWAYMVLCTVFSFLLMIISIGGARHFVTFIKDFFKKV